MRLTFGMEWQPGDVWIHLVRRSCPLPGLWLLGHLNLELGSMAQITNGHA